MAETKITKTNGGEGVLKGTQVDVFKSKISGGVLQAGDTGYDEARALWNAMIDRKPALIARCKTKTDVINCINFARENDVLVSIRGAGHNIAGSASANGALMIDLSKMDSVNVDPSSRTATAEPGVTLGISDRETQTHGLATPLGINSTTGVAGLTLGGGFGWTSRSFGLTVDNLLSAEVITADGKTLTANESENTDLFWGLRGGSSNFGVVTSFKYRLHPLGPEVLAGLIVHPFKDAAKVFRHYRDFVSQAPDSVTCWVVLRKAPPLPFLPEDVHGKEVFVIALLCTGDIKEAEKNLEPLRKFGEPIADVVAPSPFTGFQQAFDPLLTPGARNYWKSHNFASLSDGALSTFIEYAGKLPTDQSEIFIAHLGGAVNRVPKDSTAYPHRDANFVMNVHTRWEDPALDGQCVGWARKFFDETAQYATGGVYVNFISEGEERVTNAFGSNYERLAKLKRKYDPTNFFKTNQNIKPA
jgi:FAD/FMN-containing dehydrogenase